MSWDNLVILLIAGNGFALLAFGIGQLLIKGKRAVNYWSFAFFTYSALVFMYLAAARSGIFSLSPVLTWMDFPIVGIAGPLFFFYFSRLVDPEYRFSWKEQWLFAPVVLFLLATPFALAMPSEESRSLAYHASSASTLWVIFCCARFLSKAARIARSTPPSVEARRLRFLIAITRSAIAWAVLSIFSELSGRGIAALALTATVLIIALYFYHLRHPELLAPSPPANAAERLHGRSKVSGLDVESAIARLARTMEEDRPYLQDDLSLSTLAAKFDLSPHQLSEILNREMGTTFKTYINRYRVDEVRRILRDAPEASIIDVALECGFRSKSSFNKLFKDETGTTPTEYRRRAGTGGGGSEYRRR